MVGVTLVEAFPSLARLASGSRLPPTTELAVELDDHDASLSGSAQTRYCFFAPPSEAPREGPRGPQGGPRGKIIPQKSRFWGSDGWSFLR